MATVDRIENPQEAPGRQPNKERDRLIPDPSAPRAGLRMMHWLARRSVFISLNGILAACVVLMFLANNFSANPVIRLTAAGIGLLAFMCLFASLAAGMLESLNETKKRRSKS